MKQEGSLKNTMAQSPNELIIANPMTAEEEQLAAILHQKSFYKAKYREGLKSFCRLKMKKIVEGTPGAPLTLVLSEIIKGLSSEIPPFILNEITQFIIAEWEKMAQTKPVAA